MRQILNFNANWLYSPHDCENIAAADFDDGGFSRVSLPHANKLLARHKGSAEHSFLEEIESYRFISCYRKHFTLPQEFAGCRVFLEFEGVATAAEVWLNGEYIGEHKGAYTGFTFEITPCVKNGGNVISVRVDSRKRSDIPPEGGRVDYCLFGGIVRNVNLIVTGQNYIEDVTITTEETDGGALVKTKTVIGANVEILDSEGNPVAAGETALIEEPHFWSIDDPYLYTARVRTEDDEVNVKFGVRSFEFQRDGVLLNGEKIKLMGVNRHEQWPWVGRAMPDKYQRRDADMIKKTGFNAVRCSHYPQSKAFLDRCDEIGLMVFEEAPGWQHIGGSAWQELYKRNICEMIARDKNHPSIISWGVRVNESDDDDALYEATNRLARSLDPTRPTHGARRQDTYQNSTFFEDIYTAHYIYSQNPVHTPFVVTEHSWDCWMNGFGKGGASGEEALAFAKDFADKANYYFGCENCAGGFAWSMFDYDNEVNYTNTDNVFYSGLYDIFRLPKTAAHFYMSQTDPKKSGAKIYIANYWDGADRALTVRSVSGDVAQGAAASGGVTEGNFSVTVMSNCEKVELFVNGKKMAAPRREYNNLPHPLFVFDGFEYEIGEITAVGYINGIEAARYTRKSPKDAAKLVLTPDFETLDARGDITQVAVELFDEDGTPLLRDSREVEIRVSGAGDFIGEEKINLEGGRCAFMVKSRAREAGEIVCTARAGGIVGTCTVTVTRYNAEEDI